MTIQEFKAHVRNLISSGRIESAIKELIKWANQYGDDDLKDGATQLSSQFAQINRQENLGIISYSDATLRKNQITNSLLNLLRNIGNPVTTNTNTDDNIDTSIIQSRKVIKIFLASSNELKVDRDAFELHFGARKRKTFVHDIEVVLWEDFIDAMSQTRLQDEYNKAVKDSDIFVMLFFTKVGKYTAEEFETAFGHFKTNGKPLIYTFFKNADIKTGSINDDDIFSMLSFKKKLAELGHFATSYTDATDLNFQFSNQLEKLLKAKRI